MKFANFVYFCITRGKEQSDFEMRLHFSARNTKVYKICKLYRTIFCTFYNISQPNFTILLNLGNSFQGVLINIFNSKVCLKRESSIILGFFPLNFHFFISKTFLPVSENVSSSIFTSPFCGVTRCDIAERRDLVVLSSDSNVALS